MFIHYDLFAGAVNRNSFYFLILLFTSLHVSASTGHPQVKIYTVFRLYSLLFLIMLSNILYLKFKIKIADTVLLS
jgi:hypothetical protein